MADDRQIRISRGSRVEGRQLPLEWVRVKVNRPKGILFSPPLVGGRAVQQVRLFRPLIRQGFDMLTFSYSGHGTSGGRFSLSSSIRDTVQMLECAVETAHRQALPLHGIASSYSAIPLLRAAHSKKEPFERLVLINPLTRIRTAPVLRSFLSFRRAKRKIALPEQERSLKADAAHFVETLFPSIWTGWRQFGALERGRSRPLRIAAESLLIEPLSGVAVRDTPVLCLYGNRDEILRIFHPKFGADFMPDVRKICPNVRFRPLPGGHFLRSRRLRRIALLSICGFLTLDPPRMRS